MLFYICSNISNQFTWWELGLKLFTNMLMPLCGHVYVLILYTSPSSLIEYSFQLSLTLFLALLSFRKQHLKSWTMHLFVVSSVHDLFGYVCPISLFIFNEALISLFSQENLIFYFTGLVILYMITFTFSPFFVLVCPWSDSVITLT